ncbi:hypothetical protein BCV69DRAFT_71297 [Microstroma glucosiphilum]|uniref:Uncharacterized protein n=1 Tax=Pseudomicrostroma glucosiphilum TaxID=1684307 RepID=A0A316U0J6_9BASI|nr:hypothetical protein BCV69DRAFT_71297 [Pseudomicrostroma glucosiphilum]PWN18378.1 hypothetical protein BCV69DRAFT_71297 [Pseudomicrostroma glucosiphilum]
MHRAAPSHQLPRQQPACSVRSEPACYPKCRRWLGDGQEAESGEAQSPPGCFDLREKPRRAPEISARASDEYERPRRLVRGR